MLNRFSRENSVTGLDIGHTGLKIIHVKHGGNSPSVIAMGADFFENREIPSSLSLSERISVLASKAGIKKGRVSVSVDTGEVKIKDIKIPVVPDNELNQVIEWAVKKEVELSSDSHNIDYFIHNKENIDSTNKYKIMVFMARKSYLKTVVQSVENAGFTVERLCYQPDALRSLVQFNSAVNENIPAAIVDLGYQYITVSIIHRNKLLFSRQLNLSMKEVVEDIQDKLSVSSDRAVELLHSVSFDDSGVSSEIDEARDIFLDEMTSLGTELNRSFNFYSSVAKGGTVDRVYFTGGAAILPGLERFFLEQLGIISKAIEPLDGLSLKVGTPQNPHIFSVAIGLGLMR